MGIIQIEKAKEVVYTITSVDGDGNITREERRVTEGSELERQMDQEIEILNSPGEDEDTE